MDRTSRAYGRHVLLSPVVRPYGVKFFTVTTGRRRRGLSKTCNTTLWLFVLFSANTPLRPASPRATLFLKCTFGHISKLFTFYKPTPNVTRSPSLCFIAPIIPYDPAPETICSPTHSMHLLLSLRTVVQIIRTIFNKLV